MTELQLYPLPADPLSPSRHTPARRRWASQRALALSLAAALCGCGDMSSGDGAALSGAPPNSGTVVHDAATAPPQDVQVSPSTNPFVMVDHDPLSTFATDADT